jgi:hypothetical protein
VLRRKGRRLRRAGANFIDVDVDHHHVIWNIQVCENMTQNPYQKRHGGVYKIGQG